MWRSSMFIAGFLAGCSDGAPPVLVLGEVEAPAWILDATSTADLTALRRTDGDELLFRTDFGDGLGRFSPAEGIRWSVDNGQHDGVLEVSETPYGRLTWAELGVPARRVCTLTWWERGPGTSWIGLEQLGPELGDTPDPRLGKLLLMDGADAPTGSEVEGWLEHSWTLTTHKNAERLRIGLGAQDGDGVVAFDDVAIRCLGPESSVVATVGPHGAPPTLEHRRRVKAAGVDRDALVVPVPSAWSVSVRRDVAQVFRASVTLARPAPDHAGACFEVWVDGDRAAEACRGGDVPASRGWFELSAHLPALPGEVSTVELRSRPAHGAAFQPGAPVLGAWGSPRLDLDAPATAPDVVLIVYNGLRADDLAQASAERAHVAPRLSGLASAGTWYAQARSPTSQPRAALMSLMTGLLPSAHGVGGRRSWVRPAVLEPPVTLASRLRALGHDTVRFAALSGWRRGGPLDAGFNRVVVRRTDADDDPDPVQTADERARDAFVELWSEARPPGRPMLAVVEQGGPGMPYVLPRKVPRAFPRPQALDAKGDGKRRTLRVDVLDAETTADPLALHQVRDGSVFLADKGLQALLAVIDDSALVIVTSIQGQSFGEHGAFGGGWGIFEEAVRVPLVVRWPGGAYAGTEVVGSVGIEDVVERVVSWVSGDVSASGLVMPGADAVDAVRVLEDTAGSPAGLAAVSGHWKRHWSIVRVKGASQVRSLERTLFDLSADPGELHPVVAPIQHDLDTVLLDHVATAMAGAHVTCPAPHGALVIPRAGPVLLVDVQGPDLASRGNPVILPPRDNGLSRLILKKSVPLPVGCTEVWVAPAVDPAD